MQASMFQKVWVRCLLLYGPLNHGLFQPIKLFATCPKQSSSHPFLRICTMHVIWCEWSSDLFFLRYSIVKRADNEQLFLVATERIGSLASILGTNLENLATFAGRSGVNGLNALQVELNCSKCLSFSRVRSWRWSLPASHKSFKRSAFVAG